MDNVYGFTKYNQYIVSDCLCFYGAWCTTILRNDVGDLCVATWAAKSAMFK